MIYQFFQPAPFLKEYVREYLLLHFKFDGVSINPTRAYTPCPEQCLTFDPRGRITAVDRQTGKVQRRSNAYLSGQQTACYDLHFDPDYLMLKVVFQPGALFKLFGIPLNKLEGYVNADDVLGKEISLVNEQLANTDIYEKMIQVVDLYLFHKVKKLKRQHQPIDELASMLYCQPNQFSLNWFATQACLSPRQFERKFLERIGVPARLYHRIARFNKAFELKDKHPELDWLDISETCGYTDFQHMNKDFKQFAGVTPTTLLKAHEQATEKLLRLV
ncbi:MAG: AraC family transcriptional regulator [Ferruginibacter sp.]|uniref:helix-turn-helix domain-containing protein n=1 Tax=Ferruginibacter sp. TaxID=1940288 RepID=UPI00265A27BD|nr:helix-turn-helix domain-containing protein [Ferruginibacter sp.]MDB5280034.1 AraC family transcriptional regulator [Ferruginibacter sp.]